MRSSALRVEFVLSGSAFLLALYALWLAIRRLNEDPALRFEDWLTFSPLESTAAALLFTALFVGTAFAIGALLVQLTYEYPGRKLQWQAQDQALKTLTMAGNAYEESRPGSCRPGSEEDCGQTAWLVRNVNDRTAPGGATLRGAIKQFVSRSESRSSFGSIEALSLIGSAGWLRMSAEAAREIEYRRANRQIFLGLLPSVLLGVLAAGLALSRGYPPAQTAGLLILLTVCALVGVRLAYSAARFQEQRVADLLFTAALLQEGSDGRWRLLPGPLGPEP